MSDDKWTPLGQEGMVLSKAKTHRFLRVTFRRFTWCDWCKGFIWGLGKQGLRCAECKYTVHKRCEAEILRSSDKGKKECREAKASAGDRPIFRFKVKEKGGNECLLEVDPNETVPVLYVRSPNERSKFACSDVFCEKHVRYPKQLTLRYFKNRKTVQFASRREREQLAGALAYLSHRVTRSPSTTPLRIWVGTWNMGNAPPLDDKRLVDWCKPSEEYDVICFTVQECEYKPRAGHKSCEDDWFKTTEALVGGKYFRVGEQSLQEIRVIVFAKNSLREYVTQVGRDTEATGIGGVYGNKGGACVAFAIRETRLCFVGCHLAAHQDKVGDRNSHFMEIVEELSKKFDRAKLVSRDFWFTNDYHHVFWAGDLNYRIDYERGKVVQTCYRGLEGWKELYQHDQLQKELAKESVFIDFNETQPMFQPTYKYDRAQNVYPDDSKQRIPSWCDRVLWKSFAEEKIEQQQYKAVQTVLGSDHRPVFSVFNLDCKNQYIPKSITQNLVVTGEAADMVDKRPASCFKVRQLRGHKLDSKDAGGYSDPYVVFVSNALTTDYASETKKKTLNPVWEDHEIPDLYVNFDEMDYLETEYIILNVYDYDATSADDPIGQAHIGLKGICDGKKHNFCVRLLGKHGRVAGTMTGALQYVTKGA